MMTYITATTITQKINAVKNMDKLKPTLAKEFISSLMSTVNTSQYWLNIVWRNKFQKSCWFISFAIIERTVSTSLATVNNPPLNSLSLVGQRNIKNILNQLSLIYFRWIKKLMIKNKQSDLFPPRWSSWKFKIRLMRNTVCLHFILIVLSRVSFDSTLCYIRWKVKNGNKKY